MVIVMPNIVHTGYSHYILASDEVINEYAMPIVLAYNGLHHYTATEFVSEQSDRLFTKLATFIANLDSLVMKGKDIALQVKDDNLAWHLQKVASNLVDLQAVFKTKVPKSSFSITKL